MALKPVTSKKRAASPLQRPVVSPFAPAYTKETKSYAGFGIVLLLAVAGGGFYYAYNHREQAPVKAKPKVMFPATRSGQRVQLPSMSLPQPVAKKLLSVPWGRLNKERFFEKLRKIFISSCTG